MVKRKEREIANHYTVINEMATRMGVSRREADAAYRTFTEVIADLVNEDKIIRLPRFMTIQLVDREAKTARNPLTGEEIKVPAKVVAKVKTKSMIANAVKDLKPRI
jgi:DNA-binding protein HU-beta